MSDESTAFHYLNTDLDLTSPIDLTELAKALEASGVSPLHVTHAEDNHWYAAFETDESYDEPESNITAILDAVDSLDERRRQAWQSCVQREFNIGYDCGAEPWAFNFGFSCDLLRRMSGYGASLRITLYPPREPRRS
ncbi:MAG: hypothetical protein WBC44_12640 [Planctomycetaceae bacterium]